MMVVEEVVVVEVVEVVCVCVCLSHKDLRPWVTSVVFRGKKYTLRVTAELGCQGVLA